MSKYHAQPVVVDNVRFHSTKEAHRYQELKLLQHASDICCLELQPDYVLEVNGIKLGTYVADFTYCDTEGAWVIEDVKGFKTPLYKWKKRHVEAQYGVTIVEV